MRGKRKDRIGFERKRFGRKTKGVSRERAE
jgi:hypothetical protein